MTEQVKSVKLNKAQSSYLQQLRAAEGLPPGLELCEPVLSGATDAMEGTHSLNHQNRKKRPVPRRRAVRAKPVS